MKIGLLELISPIHNREVLKSSMEGFINKLKKCFPKATWVQISAKSYADVDLPLIFVLSGGVEGQFKEIFPDLEGPFLLLSSDQHNSLPATMEILTYIQQKDETGEILHGDITYIKNRMEKLLQVFAAKRRLNGSRLGVIGAPSDWLIASNVNYDTVYGRYGVQLIDIPMSEIVNILDNEISPTCNVKLRMLHGMGAGEESVKSALAIYSALKKIIQRYNLQGLTVRCFDLLESHQTTGCLALALLNDEGIVAGCEGDIPALITMMILKSLSSEATFISNPARVDVKENTIVFAHCTIPFSMVESYHLDTHFESGLGVGVKGLLPKEKRVTVLKVAGDCQSYFVSKGTLKQNLHENYLCRTQFLVQLEKDVEYFLRQPIGNHHIICKGDYVDLVKEFFFWMV